MCAAGLALRTVHWRPCGAGSLQLSCPTFEGPRSLGAEDLVTACSSRVTTSGQSPRWLLLTPSQRFWEVSSSARTHGTCFKGSQSSEGRGPDRVCAGALRPLAPLCKVNPQGRVSPPVVLVPWGGGAGAEQGMAVSRALQWDSMWPSLNVSRTDTGTSA